MITPELLDQVVAAVSAGPQAGDLRTRFPGVHFTECSEDDLNPRYSPVVETPTHAYYLVTGKSGHCLEITSDHASATGIVVATKADE